MPTAEEWLPRYGSVLILEDDASLAQLLGSIVAWTFDYVAVCHDVDAALTEIRQGGFDVLVVDAAIGRQSGVDFLRAVRAAGVGAPAVITTGLVDELPEKVMSALDVRAVLRKPYPLEVLEATLQDVTSRAVEIA